jgi:diamine N-acetyltransferase
MTTINRAVRLDPVRIDNLEAIYDMKVAPGHEEFVAANPWSLAQAVADTEIAWPRAVVTDDGPVGFLMLAIDPNEGNGRPFWLWRLMVAAEHQRSGIGTAALDLACEEVRSRGGTELYTSWVEAEGGPGPFYLRYGFRPTGEIDDETVARLSL